MRARDVVDFLGVSAAVVALVWVLSAIPTERASPGIDRPLLAQSSWSTLQGQSVTSDDLLAGPLLLNVWASWCVACQLESEFLNDLTRRDVPVIGINLQDNPGQAKAWLERFGNPYRFSVIDDGRLSEALGVTSAPVTLFINSAGQIEVVFSGVLDQLAWSTYFGDVEARLGGAK